jgi:G:T-mismatch repair DNA endonuclease (very short patch repair protein)
MDSFIENSIKTHNDKFTIVNYDDKKYRILCNLHNIEFETTPAKHLSQLGGGCKQCSMESRRQKRQKPVSKLLEEFNQKHGNKFIYPYIEKEFKNVHTNITIVCPDHCEFTMTPYSHHKSKYGCDKCGKLAGVKTRITTEDKFIKQLKDKFGETFDYTKVVYNRRENNIILICNTHKCEFIIKARDVLTCKIACPDCVLANRKKLAKPLEQFIEESNAKYDNKFKDGFTNTIYINSKTAITYECPLHGEVSMIPHHHLSEESKTGCPRCSGLFKRTCDQFIADATEKHKGYYTYPRCNFVNLKSKIIITCPKHGDFTQNASCHLHAGHGCSDCGKETISQKLSWKVDEVIEEIRKKYEDSEIPDDYSLATIERITGIAMLNSIRCINHDYVYNQRLSDHLNRHRCPKCMLDKLSLTFRMPYSDLISKCKEIHKDTLFEYQEEEPIDYKNGYSKIRVSCNKLDSKGNKHGDWYPSAHNHINGSGCPKCGQGYSQKAIDCLDMLSKYLEIDIQHIFSDGGEYRIEGSQYAADGYNEQYNVIFEFHGCVYHGCIECYPERNKLDIYGKKTIDELYNRTQIKKDYCLKQGYKYIEVWECEWDKYMIDITQFENFIENVKKILWCNNKMVANGGAGSDI